MTYKKQSFLMSLFILALLSQSALAITIQDEDCHIYGDPDVYGPGVRYGFYLQWASILIFQFFTPSHADMMRPATAVTVLSVYINTLRNVHHDSLMAIDWLMLWYITAILVLFNLPSTTDSFKRTGSSLFVVATILSIYYITSPWIIFKDWNSGRQYNCDVKSFLFVPINAYAHGWVIFLKVIWTVGGIFGLGFFAGGLFALWEWLRSSRAKFEEEEPNSISATFGLISLTTGAISIAMAEMTIKVNHITFPGTHITDSGQLIALLIGIFTLFSAVVSSVKAIVAQLV